MRGGNNPGNLTHGNRRLRFEAHLGNAEAMEQVIAGAVQTFSRSVRDEVMNDATVLLESRARHYIREGKERSGIMAKLGGHHPRSKDLENSFRSLGNETDKMKVWMGEGIPYANLRNLPEGETRTLVPQNGRFLLFRWYKLEKKSRIAASSVEAGGNAFWDRALEDVRENLENMTRKAIKFIGQTQNLGPAGEHRRGTPRLKNNAKARSQRL